MLRGRFGIGQLRFRQYRGKSPLHYDVYPIFTAQGGQMGVSACAVNMD